MNAPRRIETARLVLTPPNASDATAIFNRYASDFAVTKYLCWPRHESIGDTQSFLNFSAWQWEHKPAGPYLIRSSADGQIFGSTGLDFTNADETMTGYVLAEDSWGKGYATEALRAMIEVARSLGVRRLLAHCHPLNGASMHVLEKCDFTRDHAWAKPAIFPNIAAGVPQVVLCFDYTFVQNKPQDSLELKA